MEDQKTGRQRRSVWSVFEVEEGFKHRQIMRLLALTVVNVTISTVAFIAYQNYEMNALRDFGLILEDAAAPGLVRIVIAWAAFMAATCGLFALLVGILMTHRMAGPIYKFKQELQRIEAGHAPRPIILRKRDEFHDVAEALTRALETLWSRVGGVAQSDAAELALDLDRIRSAHEEILAGLEGLDVELLADGDRSRVEAWRRQLRTLRSKLGP
jgi:methyl-accepting chemotaxis protein